MIMDHADAVRIIRRMSQREIDELRAAALSAIQRDFAEDGVVDEGIGWSDVNIRAAEMVRFGDWTPGVTRLADVS